jgi:CheY-like chemotaxis protein
MQQLTLLVCEDEDLIRENLAESLREYGYRVLEAPDVTFAQTLFLAGEVIHLLITDILMPGALNGIALAKWVRERYPPVRIIIATGWYGPGMLEDARSFDGFLMKPYSFEDLLRLVQMGLSPAAMENTA